ncbi:T-box transcription factor TBX6-like [Zophobas morio]|uniref:T-box transcription factor TBX6-like n=1 Tax=Zophobas morio TaxID=2755281 RepID=UPI0030837432
MNPEMVVVDRPVPREYFYSDPSPGCPVEKAEVRLVNKDLWGQFHNIGTEMIITKLGRNMFPHLVVKISNLDPKAHYCVFLEMALSNRCRFKFSSAGGWSPAGQEESQSSERIYMHPSSPALGSFWMEENVSFAKIKITNACKAPSGQLILSSMHKYQPRIFLVKHPNPQALRWGPTKSIVFPETQFIAVTAYQNERVTKLKINYNPFAKGFRENGKSHSKRKQGSEAPDSPSSKRSATPSPPPPEMVERDEVESQRRAMSVYSLYDRYYYSPYPIYPQYYWPPTVPVYYPYSYRAPAYYVNRQEEVKKPKKITDFSINGIINS